MERESFRVVILHPDDAPELGRAAFRAGEAFTAVSTGQESYRTRIIAVGQAGAPELNAADIIVFGVTGRNEPEANRPEIYRTLTGMNLAGKTGGVYRLSPESVAVEPLELLLAEAGFTTAGSVLLEAGSPHAGDDLPGADADDTMGRLVSRILAKQRKMLDARRSISR